MGRASGIVSGESYSRLRDGNLSRGREGGSIGSRGSSNGSSGISSYRASSVASWDTSKSLVSSAIGKTSSIDLGIGGSHTGRENDKLVHGVDCWFGS